MNQRIVVAGGPCTCRPGRYVRYFVPRVPGLRATIYCREVGAGKEQRDSHPVPSDAMLFVHVPGAAR